MTQPTPMGHEYCGIVEEVGSDVHSIKPGQFVIGSFFNTCPICQAGYQSSCAHREYVGMGGAQSELLRVPLADGTLVATSDIPSDDLIPRGLLAASDVLGTGWFGAVAAEIGPGKRDCNLNGVTPETGEALCDCCDDGCVRRAGRWRGRAAGSAAGRSGAAKGPGHASIQTTLRYKAIYPTEAIEAHRAFIARRRATRPGEEYRTPTDEGMGRLPRPLREAESLHRHLRTRLRNTLRP